MSARRNPIEQDLRCPHCKVDLGVPRTMNEIMTCPSCRSRVIPTYVIGPEVNHFYYRLGPVRR